MVVTEAAVTTAAATLTTATASTASGSGAQHPGIRMDWTKFHFPEPLPYWAAPGEQPIFRMWWTMVDNYIACLEEQRDAADPVLSNSYKNRLLYSLLSAEGIVWFASHPMATRL